MWTLSEFHVLVSLSVVHLNVFLIFIGTIAKAKKKQQQQQQQKQMSNLEFSSSVFIANFELFGQRLVKFTKRCPSISKLALKTLELNSRLLFCFVVVVFVFCLCNCTYKNKKYIKWTTDRETTTWYSLKVHIRDDTKTRSLPPVIFKKQLLCSIAKL